MKKDLQAFEQLKELANGKNRPRVRWLGFEEKKGGGSSEGSGNYRNGVGNNAGKSDEQYGNGNKHVRSSFLQETGKKDDRIREAQTDQSLRNLSQARLRALLAAQQRVAESPMCKRLPDGGAKIMTKLAQIQAALDYVIYVDALVSGLEINLGMLNLEEKGNPKQLPQEADPALRDLVAKKVQLAQRAKAPYSQASLAVNFTPDGTFRGVPSKYRSGAPKFLTLAEAEEINRATRKAIALQQEEQSSAVIGSQGSAFRRAHWYAPDADFSTERYREPASDFDDDEDEPDDEESEREDPDDDEEEEDEDNHPIMHLRPSPIAEMLM